MQKLKNWLIHKLGGYTKEEYQKKLKAGLIGPIPCARVVEPVEIKHKVQIYNTTMPAEHAESYARSDLYSQIKPFIHVQFDEHNDCCTAKIMILPYNEKGEIV